MYDAPICMRSKISETDTYVTAIYVPLAEYNVYKIQMSSSFQQNDLAIYYELP